MIVLYQRFSYRTVKTDPFFVLCNDYYYIGMNEIDADNDIMMKIIHHNNAPA